MSVFLYSRLPQLPTIIADNAGYDSSQLVSELRALHSEDKCDMGLGEAPPDPSVSLNVVG